MAFCARKHRYLVLVLVIAVMVVAASSLSAAKITELNVGLMSNPQSVVLKNLIQSGEYQKLTGTKINIQEFNWDSMRQRLLTDFTTKIGAFDVVYLDTCWMSEFAELGVLIPLENQLRASFDLKDFIPTLLNNVGVWNGKLYAIPYASDVAHLFYWKNLFDDPKEKQNFAAKYGYKLAVPTTFEEFRDVAEFFTRDTNGDGRADVYGTSHSCLRGSTIWNDWRQYLYAWGGDVLDKNGKPNINSQESIHAMQYFNSLKPFMPPGAGAMTSGESVKMFTDGKAAMIIEWSAYGINIKNAGVMDKVGVAMIPKHKSLATGTAGDAIGIYGLAKNKAGAARFIEWLLGKDTMKKTALAGVTPGRKSVLSDPKIQESLPHYKFFLETYEKANLVIDPRVPTWAQMREIIGEALSQAFANPGATGKIFADAQKTLESIK